MSDKEPSHSSFAELYKILANKKDQATRIEKQSKWPEAKHLDNRSKTIDEILENYATQQEERYTFKRNCKGGFVKFFCILATAIIIGAVFICGYALKNLREYPTEFLTCIIAATSSCFASIVSILLIIVKYVFPSDEETNFNNLVTIIVENDTKRLKDIQDKDSKKEE